MNLLNNNNEEDSYAGFIALLGAPNAGKSTLLNQLVGSKVSIVTHKVQTTRSVIQGIVVKDNYQVIFLDTPGIFSPKGAMDKMMVGQAWGSVKESDIVTVLIDASLGFKDINKQIVESVRDIKIPKILVLNKIDLVRHQDILELIASINKENKFDHIFMLSALHGKNCQEYLDTVCSMLPKSKFYYDDDSISNISMRELAAEITREKVFLRVHKELPYSIAVKTEKYEELKDGSIRINQVIFVEREGQKKLLLGYNGGTIKSIGKQSRIELAEITGKKVHLFLFVRVQKNWKQRPEEYCLLNNEL